MEIFSLRSSQNLLYKNNANNAKNSKTADFAVAPASGHSAPFQIEEAAGGPNFASISPGELRSFARQSFDSGMINQDTFAALSEPLPMHAIDARGNLIDLSHVTDGTSFDFLDYFRNQLEIETSIGDPAAARTMQSVVDFLSDAA
ncbi:hypothetical protein HGP14_20195 [Rhizobium sp. P32RR-XVIII]|uniref:hypothetical protein n=1 Tax=Rhizobium sp. P32RR-XVIII TaxID=2726738 RepID=UPI0014576610|nr:hypothetical protein [Rhizobium sp. P32RR-XVIII]NLS05671.1 hypothetical protein [Rhizobium sp. P32RR-XVIII]